MKSALVAVVAAVSIAFAPAHADEADRVAGAEIFKKMCADCHGERGQGVPNKFDEPLYGERSIHSLAKLIDKTMPEDEPETLDAEGARKVAAYIYDAFYSPVARAKQNPPKRDFSRLTNRQFRESVADLVGSFGESSPIGEGKGLTGRYFDSNGMNKRSKQKLERIDTGIDFDFGELSPVEPPPLVTPPEFVGPPLQQGEKGMNREQFSIEWQGSLIAPETGWYEFRIKTRNGARLYLNSDIGAGDSNRRDDSDGRRASATIDGWVTTGQEIRDESARVFLLGGRAYPLKVDYFKYKEKLGYMRFEWKPPHGVWEVLAAPYLSPSSATRVAVVSTEFPPDDGSVGYERGTNVSKDWHEATTRASLEMTDQIIARLRRLVDTRPDAPEYADKLKQFAATFAERAFRRPLDDVRRQLYIEQPFSDGSAPEIAIKRSVLSILKSPRFLYPEIGDQGDQFATASRLALALWDSIPDAPLREAARRGELHTPDQIRAQAERMAQNPRARAKVGDFFGHWLAMQEAEDLSKDAKAYPGFSQEIVSDLRRSLEVFVRDVMWSDASDYRQLILSDTIMLNERLAKFYGVPFPDAADGKFVPLKFDPAQRAGIITHPFLLSMLSYHKSSSPIHRGVFLTRNVLGRFLKPPPQAIEFNEDRFDPTLTMREKVTQITNKQACMGCHVTINPLGFALENFDAVGRFRTSDANKPINPVTDYVTSDGETLKFTGPRDLAKHTAESEDARRGFVRQMFHYMVKQPMLAYGGETLEHLDGQFVANNCNMRKLLTEIAVTAATPTSEPSKTASR
jgi:cytochrome c553